jgi:hypothetical protein
MHQIGGFHDGQHGRHADTVVRAQRGSVGGQVLAVEHRLDCIRREIEVHVGVLLVHHVQVPLEHGGGGVLLARRPGLLHHHVPRGVDVVLQAEPLRDADHEGPHLLLFLGPTGDGENLVEMAPERLGLEVGYEGHEFFSR